MQVNGNGLFPNHFTSRALCPVNRSEDPWTQLNYKHTTTTFNHCWHRLIAKLATLSTDALAKILEAVLQFPHAKPSLPHPPPRLTNFLYKLRPTQICLAPHKYTVCVCVCVCVSLKCFSQTILLFYFIIFREASIHRHYQIFCHFKSELVLQHLSPDGPFGFIKKTTSARVNLHYYSSLHYLKIDKDRNPMICFINWNIVTMRSYLDDVTAVWPET